MQAANTERSIDEWRAEIDRIDSQLVDLLNRRAECALGIGHIKRRTGQPVYVPERERAVIERVTAKSGGPLPKAAMEAIFQTIIGQTRLLEDRLSSNP